MVILSYSVVFNQVILFLFKIEIIVMTGATIYSSYGEAISVPSVVKKTL
jgi:hypothetical protein